MERTDIQQYVAIIVLEIPQEIRISNLPTVI